jgi:FkbM family methyltransferase
MSIHDLPRRAARSVLRHFIPERLNESRLIFQALAGPGAKVMVDVGAHVGGTLRPFAEAGWSIFAFEPDAVNRSHLERNVAAFGSVQIDPRAVSVRSGETVSLFRSPESTGISTLTPFVESHVAAGSVTTTTLKKACEEYGITEIDFLKIDTEGYDMFVLQSLDWNEIRPRAILCEFEDRKTIPLGYGWQEMADLLVHHGYSVTVAEWYPVTHYGGRHRFRRFADYPSPLVDDRATGNLVAFLEDADLERFQEIRRVWERRRFQPHFVSQAVRGVVSAVRRFR